MTTPGPFPGLSWSTANHITLGVVAAAIVFPTLSAIVRLFSSPWALLVFSPLFVLFVVIAFVAANIFLGYALDVFNARHNVRAPTARLRSAAKPLAFATPAAWQAVLIRSQWSATSPLDLPPLLPELPVLSAGLNQVITLVVRDFVLVWYKQLSSSPIFPGTVSKTIHSSLDNLFSRVDKLDLPALVVKRVLPKITMHIDQFRQSEIAVRGAGLERHLTQSDELDMLLASRYAAQEPSLKLHPAIANLSSMHTRQTEEAHLRAIVDAILPHILPEKEAQSRVVHVVAREIVACAILYPVMEMLSDPDFWNKIIDQTAGAAIRQQKLISKVRSILDTSSQPVPSTHSSHHHPRMVDITSRTGLHQFEAWLRSISRIDSLLDARRLKNDIANEIRKKRLLLANHEKEDWIAGDRTEDLVAYLQRLYTAKNKVEERIAVLSGGGPEAVVAGVGATPSVIMEHASETNPLRHTLRDILSDPNSLSYFMEFMDRRSRSQRVQFWLHVESFKNPLESVESGGESDDEEALRGTGLAPNTGLSATIKEDMRGIYEMYFYDPKSSLLKTINAKHVRAIQEFAQEDDFEVANVSANGMMKERRVRRSVLLAQRQVEKEMEEDFQEFERSDLWFRAVGDLEPKNVVPPPSSPPPPPVVQRATSPPLVASPGVLSPTTPGFPHSPVQGKKTARPHFITPAPVPTATLPRFDTAPAVAFSGPTDSAARLLPTKTNSTPSNLDLLFGSTEAEEGQDARAPLFADARTTEEEEQSQRIEAIQAALTDIIADENRYSSEAVKGERSVNAAESADGFMTRSITSDSGRLENGPLSPSDERAQRRRKTWMFDDAEEYSYEEDADHAETEVTAGGWHSRVGSTASTSMAFEPALPGDLQLSYDIAKLTEKITKLQSQEVILDALMRKAELTGDAQELRILAKSKSAMARELRELTFQRAQYEQQEAENRLVPDRTKVAIVSSTNTAEDDGKQVVRYLIEVQQLATDGSFASGWIVARRYNDFFGMHQRLKEKYVAVRGLDFPGKRLVTSLSSSFVDTRRLALERYMQNLIAIRLVCESEELQAFLSRASPMVPAEPESTTKSPTSSVFPGQGIVRTMYKSVTESIDDMFFGPSMLDVMIQRLTRQAAEFAGIAGSGATDEDLIAQALKSSSGGTEEAILPQLPGDLRPIDGESGMSTFSRPICDLILAVFELDKKNNWLRRQAIVIILQQVLGGTIERKLREVIKSNADEGHLVQFLAAFRSGLWPGGNLKLPSVPRTVDERARTRDEANRKLSALMPDLAANMIGRSNARRGARRIFAVLQNRRLNQHIVYSIVDEVVGALFPETQFGGGL